MTRSSVRGADVPRRVLFVIDTLEVGGPARVVATLAAGLRGRGVDARVAHVRGGESGTVIDALRNAGVPLVDLGMRRLLDPRPALRLARYLRREAIGLVHTHNRYGHFVGRPAAALASCPIVSTDHWIVERDPGWRGAIRDRLDDASRGLCAAMVTISEAQHRTYRELGRLPDARAVVIRNGVDVHVFRPDPRAGTRVRASLGVLADAPLFVTVAMLRPGKGHAYLLDAMARLAPHAPPGRPAHLLVVGDGPERSALEAQAARLGLDATVHFLGTRSDVPALLAAADAYVHPSLHETLPTSILEAMAVGLPIVAARTGGVPELVFDETTGLLVPPATVEPLVRAMARLFDPALRTRLGGAARAWVEANASSERWLDAMTALYARVAGWGAAPRHAPRIE